MASLLAWPGVSLRGLGWKVLEGGALPGGSVFAWNSGAASLPTRTPGLCCEKRSAGWSRAGKRKDWG